MSNIPLQPQQDKKIVTASPRLSALPPQKIMPSTFQPQQPIGQSYPQSFAQPFAQPVVLGQSSIGPQQISYGTSQPQLVSSQVQQGQVIQGESRIEYVPYERTVTEYEEVRRQVQVPVTRQITEYQAIQYDVEYIPQVIQEKQIEYVPVERYAERVEYQTITRQNVMSYPSTEQQVTYQQQPVTYSQPITYQQPATYQQQITYQQPIAYQQQLQTYQTYAPVQTSYVAPTTQVRTSQIVTSAFQPQPQQISYSKQGGLAYCQPFQPQRIQGSPPLVTAAPPQFGQQVVPQQVFPQPGFVSQQPQQVQPPAPIGQQQQNGKPAAVTALKNPKAKKDQNFLDKLFD